MTEDPRPTVTGGRGGAGAHGSKAVGAPAGEAPPGGCRGRGTGGRRVENHTVQLLDVETGRFRVFTMAQSTFGDLAVIVE